MKKLVSAELWRIIVKQIANGVFRLEQRVTIVCFKFYILVTNFVLCA